MHCHDKMHLMLVFVDWEYASSNSFGLLLNADFHCVSSGLESRWCDVSMNFMEAVLSCHSLLGRSFVSRWERVGVRSSCRTTCLRPKIPTTT